MPDWPAADIDIDETLVRELIAEQHQDLAGLRLVHLNGGWDNEIWRLGGDLLVRLPRRKMAAELVVHEQRWLPGLAQDLPLPVPAPLRVGRPGPRYPWNWSIVPWIEGTPGDRTPLADPSDAARTLGRFLAALHQRAPGAAPRNPWRGIPLLERAATIDQRFADVAGIVDVAPLRPIWQDALDAPTYSGAKVWLHGDMHPANILVHEGALAAVIDFGDICAGDPATDLAAAWMLLPLDVMPAFEDCYGPIDASLRRRSAGWAVLFALMLIDLGKDDRGSYTEMARATLERLTIWHDAGGGDCG
ncbi:MAG: aminoglycoside phosphotransferase family protein [Acidimicrobiales bacterium]